jgi:glycyl-tRNA synthetase
MDEIGTPFAITVDFESLENGTVTLRERDSTQQRRMDVGEVLAHVTDAINS